MYTTTNSFFLPHNLEIVTSDGVFNVLIMSIQTLNWDEWSFKQQITLLIIDHCIAITGDTFVYLIYQLYNMSIIVKIQHFWCEHFTKNELNLAYQ